MAITENPIYQRFPTQIIPKGNHSPRWAPVRASSPGADARAKIQSRPYWFSDLSGCQCTYDLKDYIYSLLWRNGPFRPVLNFVPTFCEIGKQIDTDFNGNAVSTPEYQGQGTGAANQQIQLRKRLLVPGYENELIYYDVTKPNIDYPALHGLARTVQGPVEYIPMPELQLWTGTTVNTLTLYSRNLWSVNRDTGAISVTTNQKVWASGGFYILQILPPAIPMSLQGGLFVIDANITLEEPSGGK